MQVVISGIGTAVPMHQFEQAEAGAVAAQFSGANAEQAHLLNALYRLSSVETRGSVILNRADGPLTERQEFFPPRSSEFLDGPSTADRMRCFEAAAAPLAVSAASRALQRSSVDPERVTHLVTVTCSGFSAPGFDFALIRELPLRSDIERTQIGFMGCQAALNALRVARAFVLADPQAVVLVCCVELCSLHYQYGWDSEQIVANALFADGAAACIVQAAPADAILVPSPSRILASGSTILPDSADAMSWRITDHGFRMTLSSQVPSLLSQFIRPWLTEWLSTHGLTPADITQWAVHPGGPQILQVFAKSMELTRTNLRNSYEILRQHGNMSSCTILFVLDRLREQGGEGPCVAIGFGPGLTAEATLLV
ncbi:MAG: Alpha-pyrone synthesis polyketide synthase-like Pks18 [Planctomycetaceae bacterium]|nr:Alpha-pyrone synthesis polyketide synthase-like Pks18 [Planctomycetaceae bacterium]